MDMRAHALFQERTYGLPVEVAIFTNLTQDHLDYHGTMAGYAAAKAKRFAGVGTVSPRVAILNRDDPWYPFMADAAQGCSVRWTYGADAPANFHATALQLRAGKTQFHLTCPFGQATVTSQLTGRVNVFNLLAAMAAAMARGLAFNEVVRGAATLQPVPGRFQTVANTLGITVVVDYAHTDDALRNLIALARELTPNGRILTVFGCGGNRDRGTRPKMGAAAAEASDLVFVTSDNSRDEDPAEIAAEIVGGIQNKGFSSFEVVLDRATAIRAVLEHAHAEDIVLIAGKGHEKTQTAHGIAVPFDDVIVAAAVLRELEAEQVKSR